MKCKHHNDITVSEFFEGIKDDKIVVTCMYCGKQYDKDGKLIFEPCQKTKNISVITARQD